MLISFRCFTDPAVPRCSGDTCPRGATLHINERITSQNGRFTLDMQEDGNLVLICDGEQVNWASDTNNLNVKDGLVFQADDGNLLLLGPNGEVHWSPNVYARGAQKLIIQDDGNLVLYTDNPSVETWIWKTATDGKCGGHVAGTGYGKSVAYPSGFFP